MPELDTIVAAVGSKAAPVGKLLARSGQQLAAQEAVPDNPGSTGNTGTSSAASGSAPAASSAPAAAGEAATAPAAAPEPPGLAQRALHAVGSAFAVAIDIEQMISTPFAMVPFPGQPAMCVGDQAVGLPHAHNHPPNLTPPNPVPVPLPGAGPVISIPYLSGAMTTLIEGRPAARCGDLGGSFFCGGFFPMYELFLGSSSVWVEGARQARGTTDISKHCIFTSPRPSDPPIGPMIGMTFAGTARTLIGGMPMPSLLSLAMGALFKGLFKGVGAAVKRLRSEVALFRFLKHATIAGDDAFVAAVKKDLARMSRTAEGRANFARIRKSGKPLEITSPTSSQRAADDFLDSGDHCRPHDWDGHVKWKEDPNGPYLMEMNDGSKINVSPDGGDGPGTGSTIVYEPANWPSEKAPGSPSDVVLAHEMNHAANNAEGKGQGGFEPTDQEYKDTWTNPEEENTVGSENRYREQRGGVPQRTGGYGALP